MAETPSLVRGHLAEPPRPPSRCHQLIKPTLPQQQGRMCHYHTRTHARTHTHTHTQKKRQNERSGPPPPQHLGELLLFSGCLSRPLDISGIKEEISEEGTENTHAARRDARGASGVGGLSPYCGTGCMSAGGAAEETPPSMRDQKWLLASSIHGLLRLCAARPSDSLCPHQW